jgi:cyclophilin family peptidyl-prolyl cis-trans isomerase/WD40 repeat protein
LVSVCGKSRESTTRPSEIKFWNPASGELLKTVPADTGLVAVALRPDAQQLATISLTKDVKLWDVRDAREVATLASTVAPKTYQSGFGGLAWSADGQRLVLADTQEINIRDADTQEALFTFLAGSDFNAFVHSPSLSRDGLRLAFVSSGLAKLSGPPETDSARVLRGHQNAVLNTVFSPDSRVLATTGYDSTIRIWDVPTGRELHHLPGRSFPRIFFRPDSQVLAVTTTYGVKLFDVGSGKELTHIEHDSNAIVKDSRFIMTSYILDAVFSPDGQRLATIFGDRTISIWNIPSRAELRVTTGHTERWTNLALSDDGRRLFARDARNTVLCWDVETGKPVNMTNPLGNLLRVLQPAAEPVPDVPDGPPEFSRIAHDFATITRSRDGRWLAIPLQNHIRLIDRHQPLPPDEQAFREAKARLDPWWHSQQAELAEKARQWSAAAFHLTWARMALERDPQSEMQQSLREVATFERLKSVCQKLADESTPEGEPVSFPRATIDLFAKLNEPLPAPSPNKPPAASLVETNRRAEVDAALADVDFKKNTYQIEFQTTAGPLLFDLDPEVAPEHCRNFIGLTKIGFYNGIIFHRVVKGFVVQVGCPKGNGTGGPGYTIKAEFNDRPHTAGVLSMARARDPNSAGSQFFICLDKAPHLDKQSTVFGKTADQASLDVALKIGLVRVDDNSRPIDDIKITGSRVIVRPKD